ncbi:MAG: hypothetical protein AB7O73_11525 [Bacteroidia bacterium]
MIVQKLEKIDSPLAILHEIPTTFFSKIEKSKKFDDNLFPTWVKTAFSNKTALRKKFELVYNKYKAIKSKKVRDKILKAFSDINKIEHLCKKDLTYEVISIKELPPEIQDEISNTFLYLYNDALNHPPFEQLYNDTISKALDRFIKKNGYYICPVCGLEGYINLSGQSRIELDHWLYKDLFPFTAVNFDNLIPLGDKCNSRPAKGTKNVLLDEAEVNRIVTYYPYTENKSVALSFLFKTEPTINSIQDDQWTFTIEPNDNSEKEIFDNWQSTFNIVIRYEDFFRKVIFECWENNYKSFVTENPLMNHATTVDELKQNLLAWKSTFQVKSYIGAMLYRIFIDYLVNSASNAYLDSLCRNFQRP